MLIIKEKVDEGSVIYTDGFKIYDGLADYGYKKHYRVKHGESEFAKGQNHTLDLKIYTYFCLMN